MGSAMVSAQNTSFTKSFASKESNWFNESPKTFRMLISLVRCTATSATKDINERENFVFQQVSPGTLQVVFDHSISFG